MKRYCKFFLALLTTFVVFSCVKEGPATVVQPLEKTYSYTFVLSQDAATKALLEEGGVIAWEEGDKMAVYISTGTGYELVQGTVSVANKDEEGSQALVSFSCSTRLTENTPVYSYYPYHEDETTETVTMPVAAEQDGTMSAMPMVGKLSPAISGTGDLTGQFLMMNLGGAFQFRVYSSSYSSEKIEKIKMEVADGEYFNDEVLYDFLTNETVWGETGSNAVSVQTRSWIDVPFAVEDAQAVQMIVAPGSYANPKITIYTEKAIYTKTLSSTYDIARNNLKAFKASLDSWNREARPQATITWSINGEETQIAQAVGTKLIFPEAAEIDGYEFMGWGMEEISDTQQTAPEMINTNSDVSAVDGKTYFAVYAKTAGHETATHTITYETANIPSSYGASADIVLNGVTFNVTQMYKNGEKMQWRAAGNSNGTGALFNKDAFDSIQSVAITYTNEDNKKNFTVKVGDSANPTSGTDIDAAQVGETDTFVYDCSSSAPSYFVLTNGENAGYLSSIVITYLGGEPTYADYCTSIDTRTVTSLAWSAPLATVKLNGDDNEFPELTGDPEEVLAGVVYSSSETSVADIDESGVVTLKAVGETTITAAFPDGDKDYQPSSASYTLVVTAPAKHTVTFSINGNTSSEEVDEGDHIEFPNDPEISGVVFRGWTKAAIVGTQAQAPDMVDTDEETMGNVDVTYYAVFATASYTDSWNEITTAPTEGQYAICTDSYFMKAAVSSNRFTNGGDTPSITDGKLTVAPASDCIWEISKPDTYYRIKNGSNYAGGTNTKNQGALLTDSSADLAKWTISYTSNQFEVINYGRSQMSSDSANKYLRNNATNGWATYASSTGSAPRLFKKEQEPSYSNYCTTVVTLSSVVVSGTPSKINYIEGESFETAGLVVKARYSDGSERTVTGDAQWAVSPAGALTAGTTSVSVTATYNDVPSAAYPVNITVNETPAVDTMDGIFAAATAAGSTETDIKVKFTNCIVTAVKNNNAYLTDNAGKGLIIYTASHGFAVNDKLNGTVNCKVQLYNGAAELTALTSTTEGLTVTKDGVVTPQTISISSLSGVNTGAVLTFESLKYNGSAFSDGENTITPYNTFITLPTLTSGRNYQVNGVYIQYNSTKEIAPRSEADFVIIEDPYLTATASKTTGIAAAGETITVTVATNVSTGWDASSNNAAFVIGNKTETTFDVVVAKNEDSDNTKSATITVTATGVPSVEITLTQDKAPKEGETTYNFADMTDFSTWDTTYGKKTTTFSDGAYAELASANKNTSTITDCPVTKGGDVIFKAPSGKNIKSLTFECTQWTTKAQTITLNTSSNGTDFTATSTTSSNFTLTASNLSNVRAVKFTFSSASNQVGIKSITVTYEDAGSDPEPTSYSVNVANNIANGTVTANPTSAVADATITLTATPADGYEFGSWSVTNASTSAAITVTDNKFTMPAANVNVSATFNKTQGGGGDTPSAHTFTFSDVASANSWSNGVAYTDVTIDGVRFEVSGGGNNGKYYTSDVTWRFYSGGGLKITAPNGKKITAVSSNPTQTFSISDGVASTSFSGTVKIKSITVTY